MRPQLIIDCGGTVLSALLVTGDGQIVPCSQDIRGVAVRHVSTSLLFEPRVSEDSDFVWEDALESLAKAGGRDFFQRARRIGLRRPWDPRAAADALPLASPLAVLSSPVALADPSVHGVLPRMTAVLLDALLDPMFAFVAGRHAFSDVEAVVVLPAHASRAARLVLEQIFRRRAFHQVTIVRREIAAAMALAAGAPLQCIVVDATDDDLHLHRVVIDGDAAELRFRTAASATAHGLGRGEWISRIAAAARVTPSSTFERNLTTLLSGSPESLPPRFTQSALQNVLDDAWVEKQRRNVTERLFEPLGCLAAAPDAPRLFVGDIFALEAVRRSFGDTASPIPALDRVTRGVAAAMQWLGGSAGRRLVLTPGGSLRLDTLHGDAIELIPRAQLPEPGETCRVETAFRFAGDAGSDKTLLVHLQWGSDRAPEGNATLCALPLDLRQRRGDELRLALQLRRNRAGTRLRGSVEARLPHGAVAARAQFAEELEVRK